METLYYETLVAVAETGSFSEAAEAHHITQSTASRRIAVLEQHYGRQLLDRSGQTVVPTDCGRMVIEKARHILSAERELRMRVEQLDAPLSVSLGCTPGFSASFLSRLLPRFLEHASGVRVTASTGVTDALIKGVETGRYDVAFVEHCNHPGLTGLVSYEIGKDEVVFASAAASVDLPSGEVEVSELFGYPLFTCKRQCCTRKLLEGNLRRSGYNVDDFVRVTEVQDIDALRRVARETGGLAFVSRELLTDEITAGQVSVYTVRGWMHRRARAVVARDEETVAAWRTAFVEGVG